MIKITDLEKSSKGSVWVINNTKGRDKGVVTFTVPANGDRFVSVAVPLSFLPVDLANQVPKKYLLESPDFRRALTLGMLELLSDEEAEIAYNDPDAGPELRRLEKELKSGYLVVEAGEQAVPQDGSLERDSESGVLLSVLTLMDEEEDMLLSSLRVMRDDLSEVDYIFLAAHAKKNRLQGLAQFIEKNRVPSPTA